MRRTQVQSLSDIDHTCARLSELLDHPGRDKITLLRAARVLKGVNRDLGISVRRRAAIHGYDARVRAADLLVQEIERHLRLVLLSMPPPEPQFMVKHLLGALRQAFDLVSILEAEGPVESLTACSA